MKNCAAQLLQARKLKQDYEKINEANAKLQREFNAWQKEFAEPAKFYRLYKSLPQGIREGLPILLQILL